MGQHGAHNLLKSFICWGETSSLSFSALSLLRPVRRDFNWALHRVIRTLSLRDVYNLAMTPAP